MPCAWRRHRRPRLQWLPAVDFTRRCTAVRDRRPAWSSVSARLIRLARLKFGEAFPPVGSAVWDRPLPARIRPLFAPQKRGRVEPAEGVACRHRRAPLRGRRNRARDGEELNTSWPLGRGKEPSLLSARDLSEFSPLVPEDLGLIVQAGAPQLMPDGALLYTATRWEGQDRRVRLLRQPEGQAAVILFDGELADPALSPDGTTVAFAGRLQGEAGIALLDVATGEARLLAKFAGQARAPVWSPDGSRLLVEVLAPPTEGPDEPRVMTRVRYDLDGLGHLGSRTWNVYVIDVVSGLATGVGPAAWHHFYPSWAPDGRRIALVTTRRLDWDIEWVWDIYTVDLTTLRWQCLTRSDGVAR